MEVPVPSTEAIVLRTESTAELRVERGQHQPALILKTPQPGGQNYLKVSDQEVCATSDSTAHEGSDV